MEPGRYKDSCQDVDYREFVVEVGSSSGIEDLPEEEVEILKGAGMTEEEILDGHHRLGDTPYQDEDVRIEGTVANISDYVDDISLVTVRLDTEGDDPPPAAYVWWPDPLPTIYEDSEVVIWGKVVGPWEVQDEVAPMMTGYLLTCSKE